MANTSMTSSLSREMTDAIKNAFLREEGALPKCRFCGNQLKVDKTSNLKRHLQNLHQREYTAMLVASGSNTEESQMRMIPSVPVAIDQNFITQCCVKMVTAGGLPFRVLEQPGIADLINVLGPSVNARINRRNILEHVTLTVEAFRKKISNELRGQMICVKLDAATRRGRSVLAVCVQFLRNGKLVLRTLAVYDLNVSHTAETIKSEVIRVLAYFGVDISQVYAVTTDNGANFLKATRLMYDVQRNAMVVSVDYDINVDDQEFDLSDKTDQQEATDDSLEGNIDEENALNVIANAIVDSVRCAAHTLQLCVYDAIKSLKLKERLNKIRMLVKQLRTKRFRKLFERSQVPIPKLDCDTRWNAAYSMLAHLSEHKTFITELVDENNELIMTTEDWTLIDNFVEAFSPVYSATLRLQNESLTMGDLYLIWLECLLRVEESSENYIAVAIVTAMKSRQENLFESRAFLTAVYFDPRINYGGSEFLTEENKRVAVDQVLSLWERIRHTTEAPPHEESDSANTQSSSVSRVEAMLRKKHSLQDLGRHAIEKKLKELALRPRISAESDVLVYWEQQKNSEPQLYRLAQIALSVPCTQVTAERAFSALGLVLSDRRLKLSEKMLADVLFVKLNRDLFDQVEIDYARQHGNQI